MQTSTIFEGFILKNVRSFALKNFNKDLGGK